MKRSERDKRVAELERSIAELDREIYGIEDEDDRSDRERSVASVPIWKGSWIRKSWVDSITGRPWYPIR